MESIASLAISTASIICRPSTKAFWDVEITLANTPFILLANTLANHLYNPPTKLISLKSFNSSAPPFLGINTLPSTYIELHIYDASPCMLPVDSILAYEGMQISLST